ncbi:hypothetical protein [Rugosimonospora africana]|uniref:Uncharacterized protein n=1 Tax=Rugosimonospora africana TaxID=556532 RepID=A0A8J3QT91_9ACTN|nr:hypothetical protein [Rugosimonospora africana]GIH15592.1 hypothetical protein Raf01_37640 [Rugosimonospora africana]
MTANDPDGARDSGTGPAAGDDEAADWIPAPRHPDPPLPPPLEDLDVPPPGPFLDDGGWEQPVFSAPPPGPSLDLDGWDSPPATPPAPAPAPPPWPDTYATQIPQSGPPPGPAMDLGGWRSDGYVSPNPGGVPPPRPDPSQGGGPAHGGEPAPGSGPPPGPDVSLAAWGPEQQGYGVSASSGPPPGPDVNLAGWTPQRPSGPDNATPSNATVGPWSGYREGWFRRLLTRLRGGRSRS